MIKVFVVNYNAKFDYDLIEDEGSPVYMTEGFIPSSKHNKLESIYDSYAKSADKSDILFLSGSPLICAIALSAWFRYHDSFTVMQYSNSKSRGSDKPSRLQYNVTLKSPSNDGS